MSDADIHTSDSHDDQAKSGLTTEDLAHPGHASRDAASAGTGPDDAGRDDRTRDDLGRDDLGRDDLGRDEFGTDHATSAGTRADDARTGDIRSTHATSGDVTPGNATPAGIDADDIRPAHAGSADAGADTGRDRPSYPGEATDGGPGGRAGTPGAGGTEVTETVETVEAGDRTGEDAQGHEEPLIANREAESYRDRWQKIQGTFVDDPKDAVRSADALVAEVIQSLAETFADHKKDLEGQWSRGEDVETEGLRMALQQYRTFFNKLLHA